MNQRRHWFKLKPKNRAILYRSQDEEQVCSSLEELIPFVLWGRIASIILWSIHDTLKIAWSCEDLTFMMKINLSMCWNLYQKLRDLRAGENDHTFLPKAFDEIRSKHTKDWLLAVEIYEYIKTENLYPDMQVQVKEYLTEMAGKNDELKKLINDGIYLAENPTRYKDTWKS